MATHIDTGKLGERLALAYLTNMGLTILHTNWKYQSCEIDIIANKGYELHIIEVKTRTNSKFGYPEESVNSKKFKNLQKAATQFLALYPHWKIVQYDILSISLTKYGSPEFFYIEDVHY